MEYREFLICLNAIGMRNDEIDKIEFIIKKHNINFKEIFNKFVFKNQSTYLTSKTLEKLSYYNENTLHNLCDLCLKERVEIITIVDEDYPENLKHIENPPKVLYIRGKLIQEDSISISIVGSRKYTSYGNNVLNYFVDELSKLEITIISGMAYGIDGLVHKRSLENNNRTIAVLGNGVDIIYPNKNSSIYWNTITNGAVISEYPLGTRPLPFRFPERNRIISGLSLGTIVIEAKAKSGSLITARLAAEQGREVFAVPGNINSIYSEGTNMLIRDGATLLLTIDDILNEISELKEIHNLKRNQRNEVELSEIELAIYNLISEGVDDINLIAQSLKEDVSFISSIITILELKGIITVNGKIKVKM
ncbi:DNA-processing protein DprA [Anaerosphaera multitolerans]|uniref:DNA-protecting protein DprA n=1 Tax=Anaerosphaera multitolerans TaxID=2487351 RepID=A0A437S8B0_9FIRM|nr:DNA-processing protein DprA [Anaerosphaera multitolerans]RVU55242.1 DNA-protecting protein DprA [Anaerosphaera multitolerans]